MTTRENHRQAFLSALAITGVITYAANAAGVDRSTVYRWREADPEFEEAFRLAMEEAADRIELEARRRAVDGYEEPVIHQGQPTYLLQRGPDGAVIKDDAGVPQLELDEAGRPRVLTVRKYSDTLMALILKGAKPEKFRDNSRMELTGANGGPVEITDTERAAKIAAILATAQARKEGDVSDLV